MEYAFLPASITNLYTELVQQVKSAEANRNIGDVKGSFVSKQIKGKTYWYLQHSFTGQQTQIYLGPESPTLLKTIKESKKGRLQKEEDTLQRRKLCAMLQQGGIPVPDNLSAKVLLLLSESSLFKIGAILIGTHAFQCYSQILGITWESLLKTQDIDIAQDKNISIALAAENTSMNLPAILQHAQLGFFPIPALNPKNPSTSFKIQKKELHLDLLTPLIGKENSKPIFLPALKAAAQPLRYLDYLIEDPIDCVIPYDAGILVQVPQPARFAFHKLIVASQRAVSFQAKVRKDLSQALGLFKVLSEERPGDLHLAWDQLKKHGKAWIQASQKSISLFKKEEKDWMKKFQREIMK